MKRCLVLSICVVISLVFAGCRREKEKPVTESPSAVSGVPIATTVLATIADDEIPPQAIAAHRGIPTAPNLASSFEVVFSESGRGVAYTVVGHDKSYVVHNRKRGKKYASVGGLVISPDGQRVAYPALSDGKWRMVVDGKDGSSYDTLLGPIFSPDSRHVAYEAKKGDRWYVVVDDTPNQGTIASYTTPEFSSDSSQIAYVEAAASSKDMKLIISDLKFTRQSVKWSIGDLLFVTNRDRSRIAAEQVVDGKFRIIDFRFARPDVVHEGPLYDAVEELTFGNDGESVCYCALKAGKRLIVLDNREEVLPNGFLHQLPVVRPDKKGVGVLLGWQNRSFFHQSFSRSGKKEKEYDEAAGLSYSRDGQHHAYAARRGKEWFVVANGMEGPAFDRVVTPVFSPDGKRLVYRARKDDKRFLVVADTNGRTINQHPSYEQVFQPVFTPDGKSVAYGVKDGRNLIWKVEKLEG